ncbi:MAG: glutaredoxin 3 [Caulobacterales bacterium]|nr:glutaredoxin 3 [Caulobacterales bacterium]
MATATVYTTMFCGFCARAVSLLRAKGVEIDEIAAGFDSNAKAEMIERSGGRATFPQIFIGERHVGGCDDLMALDRSGELDALLADAAP